MVGQGGLCFFAQPALSGSMPLCSLFPWSGLSFIFPPFSGKISTHFSRRSKEKGWKEPWLSIRRSFTWQPPPRVSPALLPSLRPRAFLLLMLSLQ